MAARSRLRSLGICSLLAVAAAPRSAAAAPPDPQLMVQLGHHAEAFKQLMTAANFTFETFIEKLDSDGKVTSTRTKLGHVEHDAEGGHERVIRCVEDGQDITADEQKKALKQDAERHEKRRQLEEDDDLRPPFIPAEQARYVFEQIGVDPHDPTRLEIRFVPKQPDKTSMEGTAWVSTASGTVLSLSAKLNKPPLFVDWVQFSAEFGASSSLGPAPSRFTFEGSGGLLFIHQHLRGEMKMRDFVVPPP
jgi:hypothetical protein